MTRRKKILTIIPARGGSKGVIKKNLRNLHGKSLTEWAICSALSIKGEQNIVLSSDSDEILSVAAQFEAVTPSKRPDSLSGDYVADYQVLRHELSKAEILFDVKFDCVVMLQPTSPIRRSLTLNKCVDSVVSLGHSSAWTITRVPTKYHPRKQLQISERGLSPVIFGPLVVARQELDETFIRTGVCYAYAPETVHNDEFLLGNAPIGIQCDWPHINIDSEKDLNDASTLSFEKEGLLVAKGWES
jgi:CMP-N,N'-diacetyllegionaminic acid synthase